MINYLLVSYLQNLFVNAFIQPIGLSALIKEVRRLTKTKDILPNEDACSKLVYYKIVHQYNEIWSTKKLKAFAMVYDDLQEMFNLKYS